MSRNLPHSPNAEHLHKEAKLVLRAHKLGDPSCCDLLRNLHHLRDKSTDDILATPVQLTAVQFALAMDYGFTTWNDLMHEVGARIGADPEFDAPCVNGRFAKATAHHEGERVSLSPIPRYPYTVHWVDDDGQTLRHEREGSLRCRMIANLYCAMNMTGWAVESCEVAAAAGSAFRLGFESRWAQDMEFVTDVDEFTQACDILGFKGEWFFANDHRDALAVVNDAIASGLPAFVTGWGERFGRLIIGYDHVEKEYRSIGGLEFECGIPMPDVREGEEVSLQMDWADCPSWPEPHDDWFGPVLHPDQVAKNPVFVVSHAKNVPAYERVVRVLDHALAMNRDYRIKRIHFENRQRAIDNGPPGHDGWKFTFSPWESSFDMGSRALRACADHIQSMAEPTYDFEMIHGIDTAFGGMVCARSREIIAWLRHIEKHVPSVAQSHLRHARECFTELARVGTADLGVIRTRPCFVYEPYHDTELRELEKMITTQPALIYLLSWREKERVTPYGIEGRGSPWGWRVLPTQEIFEQGRDMAVANLRRLAEARDAAFEHLNAARKVI